MDNEPYLILRALGPRPDGSDPLGESFLRSGHGPGEPGAVSYSVEAHPLNEREHRDVRHDPRVVGIAQPMPLKLIPPLGVADPAPVGQFTWGVQVTGALQSPYVGHGVTVAVLDTGIDAGHEAFSGVELVQRDFTGEGNGDADGHGTHVAGTIFGRATRGVRYAVAPGVRRALIGKVLGVKESASTLELAKAVEWAVDEGAHIINLSLAFDFPGLVSRWVKEGLPLELATSRALARYRDNLRLFDRLVDFLRARSAEQPGALLIAAAGNESRRDVNPEHAIEVTPPAAAEGIVSVAALRSAEPSHNVLAVAPFSNIRASVAGPGVDIYSATKGGGFTTLSGTSMASPHVAGVAALWAERQLQRNGFVSVAGLDAQLRGNARRERLPNARYEDVGEGLVAAPLD